MLVFTTVAWGAMFAVGKSALGVLDAYWLSAVRYVPGALVMLGILWAIEGRRAMSPGAAALRLWLFGSLGFAGFSILAFLGIAQSRPEHAAIIVALMPLITSMMNWIVRGRRPSALTLGATAVALAGVLLVLTHGQLHRATEGTLHADALVLAGVVCWVGYTMGAATLPHFSALRYTGLSMTQAHTNMGVTNGEFDAFMEDLVAVLDDFKVGKAEQDELLNLLRPMRGDIVEVDSNQVGTPLPSAFVPAPPL
jgi:drug/metabolite transporter (DMT)-like permease